MEMQLPGVRPTREELKAVSERLESKSPEEILRWAIENFGSGLTMATAFGAEGYVRLSFAASREQLNGGLDRLEQLLKS